VSDMSAFHLFPLLPAELRLEIWHHACVSPSPHPGVCTLPATFTAPPVEEPWQGWTHPKLKVLCAPPRALYQTSREARSVAVRTVFTRRYDPATDILYVPLARYDLFFNQLIDEWGPRWLIRVRHLAIARTGKPWGRTVTWGGSSGFNDTYWLVAMVFHAVCHMKWLESISVVYSPPPRCSGKTWEEGDRAGVPRYWEGATLRLLEDEEMGLMANGAYEEEAREPSDGDSITGYILGRWPSWKWHPTQPDEQKGEQQMECIREEMARFEKEIYRWGLDELISERYSRPFDRATGPLIPRFEPRCFTYRATQCLGQTYLPR
jgi:hypothetical protein